MSTELEQVLIDAIQKTQAGLSKGMDFVVAQSPELIQQLLAWNMITSGLSMMLWVLLNSLLAVVLHKIYKQYHVGGTFKLEIDNGGFIFLMFIIPLSALGIASATWSLDWLQIIIAPKLWLMEYAANLISKQGG